MTSAELTEKFQKAYEKACNTSMKFPPDIMLHFYAYYKRGTEDESIYSPTGESDLRSAFKLNALLQVKNLSPKTAKIRYIEMVEKYIGQVD